MAKTNQPLLDELSDQQRKAVLDGADALVTLADFKRRSFDLWMTVARGVAPLCAIADRPGMSRKARKNLLKDNGYGSLNDGTVSRLLLMARLKTDVRAWRDTLTPNKRDSWNSPTSICNRCPAVRKAIVEASKNRPPRQPRKTNRMLAVERALDVIGDYLSTTEDADQRAAMVERLEALVHQHKFDADQQSAKPRKRKPKVAALEWSGDDNGPISTAKTSEGGGYYVVGRQLTDLKNSIIRYQVERWEDKPSNTEVLREGFKTVAEARAFAQRDYDKQAKAKRKVITENRPALKQALKQAEDDINAALGNLMKGN